MSRSFRKRLTQTWLTAGAMALCLQFTAQAAQPRFTLSMPDAEDNAFFSADNAASANGCGGKNVSPALYWSNPPKGTQSFALVLHDPDGQKGLGVDHWLRYGLPFSLEQIVQGVGAESKLEGVGGINTRGTTDYMGPCPPPGDSAHHYVIQLYALDLAHDALKPGLSGDELRAAIKGHILGVSSVVRRYQR
ncbi:MULTISPECIES: YbhB/YbcL family Raf kinase inhibitor-like protein [unclassified Pseudomonas]|uniref:YbhB/YbcL family Raf kinase inhibitor-like protein n=1 Tax=unclassified Pseudomonas TaxID=196821 RepID=UPI002B23C621|nr:MULTISPECIES: YbhB/YbcL family Raf kinase inhibitor-like protein [unclassified Pseudomonas]MEA9977278.1 YbhB/YbcL family Raf kinase inhibitor-like protein [Pseudomonas sp. RTS4]MEB0198229.1 YbhB/YbcL family Raf kinase inhibitor-like protein [Pseudomonas sp. 5S4]MEB0247083.1 YbhB/YbcL family Raf kinase inhibitor-like protein [Pseudomonas sp. 10S5]